MNVARHRVLAPLIEQRLRQLISRVQELPPTGSRPLTVAGRVAGWITAPATAIVRGMPGVDITHEAVHVFSLPRERLSLNKILERMALAMREGGCVRSWREELLDVYGEGERLGHIERGVVRPLGLLTKAVHLNAWSADGRLWVARRSLSKNTDPNMWDTLVGGLASSGETLETALVRESKEEAGLNPQDLAARSALRIILRMHRRLPEGYQVEDLLVSDCVLADTVQPVNEDGEVSEIRLADIDEVWTMMEAGAFTQEAQLVILEGLRRRLEQGLLA